MNSQIKFLRRVRIHGGECGAVARALHHEARTLSLPAAEKIVFFATSERKSMSKLTMFKRISLAIVLALGFGSLTTPASNAALLSHAVAISSSTATAAVGDSASATITHTFNHTLDAVESATVRYTCTAPTGATCPAIMARQLVTADTANVILRDNSGLGWSNLSLTSGNNAQGGTFAGWTDSSTASATGGVRSTFSIKAEQFAASGVYTYSFYSVNGTAGTSGTATTAVTWAVTVTAPDTTGTQLSRKYISSDIWTAQNNKKNQAASSDSAIVAAAGTAASPAIVGYAFVTLANAAGDTRVAVGSGFRTVDESLTVTITGAGTIAAGVGSTGSAAISSLNSRNATSVLTGETIVIFSNGTAGTGTITVTKASNGAAITTMTVTFVGNAASAAVALSDTVTFLGTAGTTTTNLTAQLKDAGGNLINSGTFYVFSSDTKIAGSVPTSTIAASTQTGHRCGNTSGEWNTTTSVLTCAVVLSDTGTATITLRDSWTVSASTWSSNEVTLDIRGNVVRTLTVAFDKSTYAPGEKAVITLTALDAGGKALATRASDTGRLSSVVSTPVLNQITVAAQAGTQGTSYTDTTFLGYQDSGVETRVVVMPSYGSDVTYSVTIPGFGVGVGNVAVTASAKVVDPAAAATKASADAATAAAEAATDAAAEAIDAANAATDAANLAAEAADAATVAAEEARDAADAATAAVEELATQVATLMAALKAQITTLANTVAKIAKKVKA